MLTMIIMVMILPSHHLRVMGMVGPLLPATGPCSTTKLQKVSFLPPQSSRKDSQCPDASMKWKLQRSLTCRMLCS